MADVEYKDYSDTRLSAEELKDVLKNAILPKRHKLTDLVLLEKNANIMKPEVYKTLVENMKHDGRLTQWPFVMKLPDGRYGVPSGNHRVRAAIDAGIEEDWCITCEVTLPVDEAKRIQVAHNSLKGNQSNVVLLELLDEFKDIELLRLSGAHFDLSKLDDKKMEFKAIDSGGLDFHDVLFYFTDYEIKRLDDILVDLEKRLDDQANPTYILEKSRYRTLVEAITQTKREANIKSTATVLNFMIDYVYNHREEFVAELMPKPPVDEEHAE